MAGIFDKIMNDLGSNTMPLILKCNGTVRVLWGAASFDLVREGKLQTSANGIEVKSVNSEQEINKDGFYILNNNVVLRSNSLNFYLLKSINGDEQSDLLKELGIVSDTVSNIKIKNGIVYCLSDKNVYKVSDGVPVKIELAVTSSSLESSGLETYSDYAVSLKSNNLSKVIVNNEEAAVFTNDVIKLNGNVYFGNRARLIYNNGYSTLTVDNLIWKNLPATELQLTLPLYSEKSNVVSNHVSDKTYKLKYDNKFNAEDKVLITYDSVMTFETAPVYVEAFDYYKIPIKVNAKYLQPQSFWNNGGTYPDVTAMLKVVSASDTVPQGISIADVVNGKYDVSLMASEYADPSITGTYGNVQSKTKFESADSSGMNLVEVKGLKLDENKTLVTISNISPIFKFPLEFTTGDIINDAEIKDGTTTFIVNSSVTFNDLTDECKKMFETTSNGLLKDTIVSVNDLNITFENFSTETKDFFVYGINDNYIIIQDGKLQLLDYDTGDKYFEIGKDTDNYSYSFQQLLKNPTIDNPMITNMPLLSYPEEIENYNNDLNIPNIKWVKQLIKELASEAINDVIYGEKDSDGNRSGGLSGLLEDLRIQIFGTDENDQNCLAAKINNTSENMETLSTNINDIKTALNGIAEVISNINTSVTNTETVVGNVNMIVTGTSDTVDNINENVNKIYNKING